MKTTQSNRTPKPAWLKKSLPVGGNYQHVTHLLKNARIKTVCQEANCPNMFECFSKNTSTFMILGSECTRNCMFCNVTPGSPALPDPEEPIRVAKTAGDLGLKYVVITSVTRDDLEDGGSSHFVATIHAVKKTLGQQIRIEVLIPDFQGNYDAIRSVVEAGPDVLNHNIETVSSLYDLARPQADYQQSLSLFDTVRSIAPNMPLKSGIMVGLGETVDELSQTMADLYDHGCRILTIGQYLQPTRSHLEVKRFYSPEEFKDLEAIAKEIGFPKIASGPFVRSSYRAENLFSHLT
ncbi:MAG: lipoyl synthase [Desulfobacteraceae bacterium]|nr:MAG: lipoyl synthase [Desulfobacteraceae bacterium]